MLFLHLQYLALQFFNIGISFCSFSLACSSYFSFLLSKRKATPLVTAIAVMVAVFQNLSMRISDFTSLDSCSARFTGYTFCNFAACATRYNLCSGNPECGLPAAEAPNIAAHIDGRVLPSSAAHSRCSRLGPAFSAFWR